MQASIQLSLLKYITIADVTRWWKIKKELGHALLILAIIYNESLAQGNVPDDWWQANVSPVFKKGEKYDIGNYKMVLLKNPRAYIGEQHQQALSVR